jgi:RHS repeat-associated protein
MTDGLGNETVTGYDVLGRRATVTDAEGNVTQYEYDALGNQAAITDANNVRTGYVYDDLNRLIGVVENQRTGESANQHTNVLTQYVYDALGNRIVITNARNYTSTYTVYDALDRPVIVRDALGHETHTRYNALGYRTVVTDADGGVTHYGYDGLNWLVSIEYAEFSVQYAYDAVGNRIAMTDTTGTTFYTYDPANRLTSIQLPDSSVLTYTWGARGNLTHDGTFTYTYNAAGRMVQATGLTSTIVYTYSADGLRVAQNVDGVETTFAWDAVLPIAQVLATTEAGAANPARYLHGVDLVAEYQESVWQYPLGDSLGSVRQVVDAAGDVTYAAGYTSFGEALWRVGEAATAWGFTGEWQDPNVGMIYLRARWYAPDVGRFTRQDPWRGNVQQPATGNPYAYGLNNPLTCTDPTGKWCLGGFDMWPGTGCTLEQIEKWAQIWTNVIDYAKVAADGWLGFGVEILDTLLLMGRGTLANAYVENLYAKYPVSELALMLLLLDNICDGIGYSQRQRRPRNPIYD